MSKVIVCHSFPAWDTPYVKSTIELLKQLSKDYRVIMIDYHYTLKDLIFNQYAPKKQILGVAPRVRTIQTEMGQIEVLSTPPIIPINWIKNASLFNLAARLNTYLLKLTLIKELKKLGINEFTLVNAFNPVYGYLLHDTFKAKKSIYYCYDEISGTEWSGDHGTTYEQKYLPLVDEVVCTSSILTANKAPLAKKVKFIPNGVNLDLFLAPHAEKAKSKTIGYVGAVDNRIDFDLIKQCALHMSDYQFDFYGPIKTEISELPDNMKFHGSVQQLELPEKIKDFDACLIPFVKNKLTEAIYPLKINEYLAMGKPVVTTNFSDLSDFSKVAEIADNHDDFLKALEKTIRRNTRLKTQKRINFAINNSWKNRAQEFAKVL